jgi:hypothetical protein
MVTVTVRPSLWYSPLSILCEKRPDLSSPTSVTPFWLAVLLALSSSKEGLAAVSMPNVLAMQVPYPTGYRNKRDMGDASTKRRILPVTWV